MMDGPLAAGVSDTLDGCAMVGRYGTRVVLQDQQVESTVSIYSVPSPAHHIFILWPTHVVCPLCSRDPRITECGYGVC